MITIGPLRIHRKEQDDLGVVPFIAAHWRTPGHSRRIFALYRWGIQVGRWRWARRKP